MAKFFYQKGQVAFDKKEYQSAVSFFKKATILAPGQPEYFVNLAYAYHRQKDSQAEIAYQKALSMNYQNPLFYASLGLFYETEKRELETAIDYYRKAIDFQPAQYTFAYERMIELLLVLGKKKEAVSVAEKLTTIRPEADSFALLGLVYSRNARFDEAEAVIRKAISLEPDNPVWLARLGRLFLAKDEIDRAIDQLERSLSKDPKNEEVLCTLAYIYTFKKPDYQRVITYAERIVARIKSQEKVNQRWALTCFYNLGYAYLRTNQKERAKDIFRQYLERAEDMPDYEAPYKKDVEQKLKLLLP